MVAGPGPTRQFYPMQCAICGVRWDNKPLPPPPETGTHAHSEQDWIDWFTANGLDPKTGNRPYWVKIPGEDYPATPPEPPPFP